MMMRIITVSLLAGLSVFSQDFKVGGKVSDFTVQTLQGASTSFQKLKGKVTVVTFVSVQCPISNDYNERMNQLYQDYSQKGVSFIFVNPNSSEPSPAVADHAKAMNFKFPVYKDVNNVVADQFGAQVTPESYVMDSTGTVVYRGYIDDSRNTSRIKNQGLRNALDEVLEGKSVTKSETKAFGCTIKRARKAS